MNLCMQLSLHQDYVYIIYRKLFTVVSIIEYNFQNINLFIINTKIKLVIKTIFSTKIFCIIIIQKMLAINFFHSIYSKKFLQYILYDSDSYRKYCNF